ncbi:hypothetical protein NADFUDRAFT_42252 [Nadsonia fulvescens var. elongata DSM 6958]|uniref:AN1-type domain-containing protein n=1 Tax=Nadsonia fulvescens var. elongata DSM 6958 TaxID=857566 RepID=A0A1E3PHR8_9ASCO|nr:hypothetical protein NADFUDRAFT_42252 [Nadsonia fulvescens var. elongata DSM 6958]
MHLLALSDQHHHFSEFHLNNAMEREVGLLDIGRHCHLCHNLDFLPFECEDCGQVFCADHRVPDSHQCKKSKLASRKPISNPATSNSSVDKYFPDRNRVATTPSPSRITQTKVSSNTAKPKSSQKVPNALARLKGLLPKNTNNLFGNKKAAVNSGKSQVVANKNLLNLKQTARGDMAIPVLQRVYLHLQTPTSVSNTNIPVFIHKDWTVGKSLDKLTEMLDIANKNNTTSDINRRWRVTHEGETLAYGTKFSATGLKNGDTIAIVRGE